MKDISKYRKQLNQQQTNLRRALTSIHVIEQGYDQFFTQHRMLHSERMDPGNQADQKTCSYEDLIFNDLSEEQFRRIPPKSEHSIAWIIWHLARIEDVTMNILIAGCQQVYWQDNWLQRINISFHHTGNSIGLREIHEMSQTVNLQELRSYRTSVGKKTVEIVRNIPPDQLTGKIDPDRIQQIKDEEVLLPSAFGIADYWSKRTIAGLLLMPATRHNLVHLNEAYSLKNKLINSQ